MKNPHAVALGKLGGAAGTGAAKARTTEQARAAAFARWRKPRGAPITVDLLLSWCDQSGGPDACWPWLRGRNKSSDRGIVYYKGRMNHVTRVLWELMHGVALRTDQDVCHRCDNPPCVNPKHLFLGSESENIIDSVRKGRHACARKTHCKNGHAFTPENTRMVRKPKGGFQRVCITCVKAWAKKYRDQKS